jgi:hypothetical protein
LELTHRLRTPEYEDRFLVSTDQGQIRILGHLTTGSRGWRLRGVALCHRAVVSVQITAVEAEAARVADLEYHEYEVTVFVKVPGRYRLRISHGYVLRGEHGQGLGSPVHESIVAVP